MQNDESTLDRISVAQTSSLVKLYESKQAPKVYPTTTESVRYVKKPSSDIASPKPLEPLKSSSSSTRAWPARRPKAPIEIKPNLPARLTPTITPGAVTAAAKSASLTNGGAFAIPRKPPPLPPPRRSQRTLDGSQKAASSTRDLDMRATLLNPTQDTSAVLQHPKLQSSPPSHPVNVQYAALNAVINKSPLPQRPKPPPPTKSQASTHSDPKASPPPFNHMSPSSQSYTPRLSVDSLANAMVASSLASSRAASPGKPIPLPPLHRRTSKSHIFHHHSHNQSSSDLAARTPSPVKTLRRTMREPQQLDPETIEHRKKSAKLVRHPHKHHEGDRKRYRVEVTERERKRYEGVWAANRGLLIAPAQPDTGGKSDYVGGNGDVLNIVVRDIWRRSRLPDNTLEAVWDLVNLQDRDRLSREEFCVGMWLIDQRLKGNKLPLKVPESVWSSVRRLSGIKTKG